MHRFCDDRAPGIFWGCAPLKVLSVLLGAQEPTRNILGEESREGQGMVGRLIDLHGWPCTSGPWHVSGTRC